jgi:hypothetical protein
MGENRPVIESYLQAATMRRYASILATMTCLAAAVSSVPTASAQAQGTLFAQNTGVAVTFKNETNVPVIVQGVTLVNGMAKAGQAFVVRPKQTVADNNVPANSTRYYTVVDANRPGVRYLYNSPLQIGADDVTVSIRPMQGKIFIVPVQP